MGRRDRERRERVIAGLEPPHRVRTVYQVPCGKKAVYFRRGLPVCAECAARLEGAEKRASSGATAGQAEAGAPSEVSEVSPTPAPPVEGHSAPGGTLGGRGWMM